MSRFDYVAYDEKAQNTQAMFKKAFTELDVLVEGLPKGRAQALVMTKLEEAYMWIGKAVRDEQLLRDANTRLQEGRSSS